MHQLNMMSPIKRMFIGFGIIILLVVGAIAFVATTLWFLLILGIMVTAIMYITIAFMTVISLIYWQIKRYGAGVRTLVQYDPDHADALGSTARYGNPHDHSFFMPRWKGKRPPPDPTMPTHFHRPPK